MSAYRIITTPGHWREVHFAGADCRPGGHSCRPVVVIDPEDREQVERLRDLYDAALQNHTVGSPVFPSSKGERGNAMQTALRSLIAPPKPPEPKGLGAVVEDAEGQRWVKNGLPNGPAWRTGGGDGLWCTYADIAAVKVLSLGVTA